MKVKEVEIDLVPDGEPNECGSWCKADGYYADTHSVSCIEHAVFQTTYTHYRADGTTKKTRRFWCNKGCLPEQFKEHALELLKG